MKISVFKKVTEREPSQEIRIDDFLDAIKDGKWQDEVLKIRTSKNDKEKSRLKKQLPAVTISGTFSDRKDSSLEVHSGFLAIDIDDLADSAEDVKSILSRDNFIYAAFVSVSGKGVCAIIKVDPKMHRRAYEGFSDYLLKAYQIDVDSSGINESRLRFISYDPYLYINENSIIFKKYLKHQKKRSLPTPIIIEGNLDRIVSEMVDRNVNCTDDYRDWIKVGFALASELGEAGRQHFHALSQISGKYDSSLCDKKYDNLSKSASSGNKKASISTIYWYAKNAGIELYDRDTSMAIRLAASQKRNGSTSKKDIVESLKKTGIKTDHLDQIAEQVLQNPTPQKDDDLLLDVTNYIKALDLRKNLITRNIELDKKSITDENLNSIYLDVKSVHQKASKDLVHSIIFSNRIEEYNPIMDFLNRAERTGSKNIELLLDSIISDTEDYRKWVTKWLVALIATAYGKHSPLMLVFAGEKQGTGKCLSKDTPVIMMDSSIKMSQDVQVGDVLMGVDGTPRNVLSIGRGREMMYRIKQNKGMDYVVNESHILSLKNRDNKETVNVNVKDYYDGKIKNKSRLVGYRGEIINEIDKNLNIDPYFLGLWLGDGQSNVKLGIRIETCDAEIIDYLYSYAKEINHIISIYIQEGSRSNSYALVKNTGSGNGIKNNKDHIKSKFIDNKLHNNKHIPKEYFFSSRKQRLQLLAGLIDSDGSVCGNHNYEITQKSEILSDNILFLCRSLGFRATMKEKIVNQTVYYRIYIGGNVSSIPVKMNRKKIYGKNFYNVLCTGIKVEKLKEDNYYGFEIDGDNLFLLGDFTATHNTHFLRYLLPQELQSLYAESKMDAGKDDEILMTKKWIIVDDEMGGKSKREAKKFKEITSKQWINVREPYGRVTVDLRRTSMFAGTSNDLQLLNDPTGNRRYLPIHILDIDHDKYNNVDKSELLWELNNLYKDGYDYTVLKEDIENLNKATEMFKESTPEEELILSYMKRGNDEPISEWLPISIIIEYLLLFSKKSFLSNVRVGQVLSAMGYEKKRKKIDNSVMTVYNVIKNNPDAGYEKKTDDEPPF